MNVGFTTTAATGTTFLLPSASAPPAGNRPLQRLRGRQFPSLVFGRTVAIGEMASRPHGFGTLVGTATRPPHQAGQRCEQPSIPPRLRTAQPGPRQPQVHVPAGWRTRVPPHPTPRRTPPCTVSSWIRLPTDGATGDPEGVTRLPGSDRCLFRSSETSVHRINVHGFRCVMGRTNRHQRDPVLSIQKVDRVSCGSPSDEFSQLRLCLADDLGLHDLNETGSRPGVIPTPGILKLAAPPRLVRTLVPTRTRPIAPSRSAHPSREPTRCSGRGNTCA